MTPLTQALTQAAEEYKNMIAPALQTDYHRDQHARSFTAGAHAGMKLALNSPEVMALKSLAKLCDCLCAKGIYTCDRCTALAAFEKLLKDHDIRPKWYAWLWRMWNKLFNEEDPV